MSAADEHRFQLTVAGEAAGAAQSFDLRPDAAVPVVVALLYWQSILDGGLWIAMALAVFIAAGITDVLDGYFARIYGQQSSLGRMLDPIADKLLVASASDARRRGDHPWLVAARLRGHSLPGNPVSGLMNTSPSCGSASWSRLAKWKTTWQLAAVGFRSRAMPATVLKHDMLLITNIGLALLWLSALVTLYTGWDYMRAGVRHMID